MPNWPTFSVSFAHGDGNGTVLGTDDTSEFASDTLTMRSTYSIAHWLLNANFVYQNIHSEIPLFLAGSSFDDKIATRGSNFGFGANHPLPWHGSLAVNYNHSDYTNSLGETEDQNNYQSSYTANSESAVAVFHPGDKITLNASETYVDNLVGYFYQNIINNGGGVPLSTNTGASHSFTMGGGIGYTFTRDLVGSANITYYDQSYLGGNYSGTFLSGTLAYAKRILDTFTVSATVLDGVDNFQHNEIGFGATLNAYHNFGPWHTSGDISYAQNVQTALITYTTSYYNYGGEVHRRFTPRTQWTLSASGGHSGLVQSPGTSNNYAGASTSIALPWNVNFGANYTQSQGQSVLTSTGIQPIPPTPGLPLEGLIVYNGKSYGGTIALQPIPRLTISGSYSHVTSDTLSNDLLSSNRNEMFYGQFQYRFRRITMIGGYTRLSQSISAAGSAPAKDNSYFIGVARWFDFF